MWCAVSKAPTARSNDLKAEFSQTAFNKSLNQSIPAQGTVYLKKGGKLRWEYSDPTPQEIVSDGKTLWVYTPTLSQVNVGPAPEALSGPAGSFLSGLGRLREHFTVRFLNPAEPRDKDGNITLDLTPKQPLPTMSRLVLAVDPRSWEARRAVTYDQFENTVTMTVQQDHGEHRPGRQALHLRRAKRRGDGAPAVDFDHAG